MCVDLTISAKVLPYRNILTRVVAVAAELLLGLHGNTPRYRSCLFELQCPTFHSPCPCLDRRREPKDIKYEKHVHMCVNNNNLSVFVIVSSIHLPIWRMIHPALDQAQPTSQTSSAPLKYAQRHNGVKKWIIPLLSIHCTKHGCNIDTFWGGEKNVPGMEPERWSKTPFSIYAFAQLGSTSIALVNVASASSNLQSSICLKLLCFNTETYCFRSSAVNPLVFYDD